MENHAEQGEIAIYCRVLNVTPQGYAKYLKRQEKPYKYKKLLADIDTILGEDKYNSTYGKQRMYEKLQLDFDCVLSYNTVAKVMAENGLMQKKNKSKGLTKVDKLAQKKDDLLKRNFTADEPCEKSVTDITEIACKDRKIYISGVFDCFDNCCLGLAIGNTMETNLVIRSYKHALKNHDLSKSTTHSDRGCQYTSNRFKQFCKENAIYQSMNSAGGRCHDNAKCESFWARMKVEIFQIYNPKKISSKKMTRIVWDYFMDYWNNRRICSAIGGIPPALKREVFYLKQLDEAS